MKEFSLNNCLSDVSVVEKEGVNEGKTFKYYRLLLTMRDGHQHECKITSADAENFYLRNELMKTVK